MSRKSYSNIEIVVRMTLLPGVKIDSTVSWLREYLKELAQSSYNSESVTVRLVKKEIIYP